MHVRHTPSARGPHLTLFVPTKYPCVCLMFAAVKSEYVDHNSLRGARCPTGLFELIHGGVQVGHPPPRGAPRVGLRPLGQSQYWWKLTKCGGGPNEQKTRQTPLVEKENVMNI